MISSGWLNLSEIYISCYALWYCPFFFSIMSMCCYHNPKEKRGDDTILSLNDLPHEGETRPL